ncbi:hypothetical protein RFI_16351, partial [Reticulomyxa filosa]
MACNNQNSANLPTNQFFGSSITSANLDWHVSKTKLTSYLTLFVITFYCIYNVSTKKIETNNFKQHQQHDSNTMNPTDPIFNKGSSLQFPAPSPLSSQFSNDIPATPHSFCIPPLPHSVPSPLNSFTPNVLFLICFYLLTKIQVSQHPRVFTFPSGTETQQRNIVTNNERQQLTANVKNEPINTFEGSNNNTTILQAVNTALVQSNHLLNQNVDDHTFNMVVDLASFAFQNPTLVKHLLPALGRKGDTQATAFENYAFHHQQTESNNQTLLNEFKMRAKNANKILP